MEMAEHRGQPPISCFAVDLDMFCPVNIRFQIRYLKTKIPTTKLLKLQMKPSGVDWLM